MKKALLQFAILALMLSTSCREDGVLSSSAYIEASKTTAIQIGEPVTFKVNNVPDGKTANWSVNPVNNVQLNVSGNTAAALFSRPGGYKISAIVGGVSVNQSVSVDSIYYSPDSAEQQDTVGLCSMTYSILPLTEDQITLTPTLSSWDSSGYIGFTAVTEKRYQSCNNNHIVSLLSNGTGSFTVDFNGVYVTSNCCGPDSVNKQAEIDFELNTPDDATYTLTITLNGNTYTGSFVKDSDTFNFTWPYTSGVIISPLTVTKPKNTNSNTNSYIPLTGDQVNFTPTLSDVDSINYLSLNAQTLNNYGNECSYNTLVGRTTSSANNYVIELLGVEVQTGSDCPGLSKAHNEYNIEPLEDGNYGFSIILNGDTYTGSFVKAGDTYTFTWPYSSGIIISPLSVTKP